MKVFDRDGSNINIWGATASVSVIVDAVPDIDNTWVLSDVRIGAQEIVDVRKCFNDESYIYALGNDQGRCSISLTFAVFCGTCRNGSDGGQSMSAIGAGVSSYKSSRISKNVSPGSITIGGFSTRGWLISIDIGQMDPDTMTCRGTVNFLMDLEASGEA